MRLVKAVLVLGLGVVAIVAVAASHAATEYKPVCTQRTPAGSARECSPRLDLEFYAAIAPKQLPKKEMTPVALQAQGKISTETGTQPTALKQVEMRFDKNGGIDARGLPACPRRTLETYPLRAARRACHASIVGEGLAHIGIDSAAPLPVPLTLFNGGVRAGTTTVFIHGSIPTASPTPVVVALKIRKSHRPGRYGLEAIAPIPRIADGHGSLLDFNLTIKRSLARQGVQQSFASARCFDDFLQASARFTFINEALFVVTVRRACTQTTA